MSLTGTMLFFHFVGLICLFGAAIVMHLVGARLRRAPTVQEVRLWLGFARSVQPLFPVGGVLLLVTGAHLAGAVWSFGLPWVVVGLALVLGLLPAGPLLMRPRFQGMGKAAMAASPGPVPPELARLLTASFPWAYSSMTTGAALGIAWIMVQKPGWTGSIVPVVALALAGWLWGARAAAGARGGAGAAAAPEAVARSAAD